MGDEKGWTVATRRNRTITVKALNRYCQEMHGRRLLLANRDMVLGYLSIPRSPRTRNRILADARAYFLFARERGYRATDPTSGIDRLPEPSLLPRPIRESHALAILSAAQTLDTRIEAVVALMLYAGLRRMEVAKLTWSDIDLESRSLRVVGKGNRERAVPISDPLLAILVRWQRESGGMHWLFPSPQREGRRHVTPAWIWELFAKARELAGLAAASPHKMRHTFATATLKRRGNVREVQVLLGHASLASTQIYTGVDPSGLMDAVQTLKKLGQ